MRQIHHPGPIGQERTSAVAGLPVALRFTLAVGETIEEAIARGFSQAGCAGGFVALEGGRCEPFRFVIPALSKDERHAAWYSDTFAPSGPVEFAQAGVIVGRRDGRPFLHCHGIWDTSDGRRWMGHLLAADTRVTEVFEVTGIGFPDATFESLPDAETNFTLFEPVRTETGAPQGKDRPVLLARVRPNEDICLAIERICIQHDIRQARIYGIGSLNEIRYVDGSRVESHATEILIREGTVASVAGQPRARLNIAAVDVDGKISSGELVRGDNPVCVTFELVIDTLGDEALGDEA